MSEPADSPIAVGQVHRAFRTLRVLVYDYDQLGFETRILREGERFQPWEPLAHWRGDRVPITLGDSAKGFDWGVTSLKGHFLAWNDYFAWCGTGEPPPGGRMNPPRPGQPPRDAPGEHWPSPFDELTAIAGRLRSAGPAKGSDGRMLSELLSALVALEKVHAVAAEMQRGADGFDNTAGSHRYGSIQDHLLQAARAALEACKVLAE